MAPDHGPPYALCVGKDVDAQLLAKRGEICSPGSAAVGSKAITDRIVYVC